MRLVRFAAAGQTEVGVKLAAGIARAGHDDMLRLIADEGERAALAAREPAELVTTARLLAPIVNPGKMLFTGINYASHADENPQGVLPTEPTFFAKLPSAIIGPDAAIVLPHPDYQVDYEVELAMVIGRMAKGVPARDALDYVAGYTVVNDVGSRFVQSQPNQLTLAKGFDTFCPMGPEIVLKDEIPDPAALRVTSHVNDERRQDSPTDQMLFSPQILIEAITAHVTLYPGDIVTTGTPAGVGRWRRPQAFLRGGDVVKVSVDAIGTLTNPVVNSW